MLFRSDATHKLGVLSLDLNDLKRAEEYLLVASQLNPKAAETQKYIGILLYRQGFYRRAKEYLGKSKIMNSYVREIFFYLGLIAIKEGKIKEAVELLEKELAESPGKPEVYFELVKILLKSNQREKGIDVLEEGLVKNPDFSPLWDLKGTAMLEFAEAEKSASGLYVALESYDEAIKALHKSLKLDPKRIPVLERLIRAYRGAKRFAAAVPYLEQILLFKPDRLEYLQDLSRGHLANQEFDRAIDALNRYLQKRPSDADGWFQLGKIYADKGDFVDGIEIFQKSIALDPKDPKKKLFLGMLYAEVNRFSESLEILRKAIEDSEDDSNTKKRCEALIQQILEVSGIERVEAEKKLGTKTARKIRRDSKKPKVELGSQKYVKLKLYRALKLMRKLQAKGWNGQSRKEMLRFIKYGLIRNYKKLIYYKKFSNKFSKRYYYLGIRKLIDSVKSAKDA